MPTPSLPDDLLSVFAHLQDAPAVSDLLVDLLTPAELEAVAERWAIVKLLANGQSQRAVRDALRVSVTTVGRGSRQLRYGTGGFEQAFDVLVAQGAPDPRLVASISKADGPKEGV
jgi:Trp operon repressor